MTTTTNQSVTAGFPAGPSMPYVEQSPAAVAGSVRGDPRSGLGEVTSSVSAASAHPPVGGPDQMPNPLPANLPHNEIMAITSVPRALTRQPPTTTTNPALHWFPVASFRQT